MLQADGFVSRVNDGFDFCFQAHVELLNHLVIESLNRPEHSSAPIRSLNLQISQYVNGSSPVIANRGLGVHDGIKLTVLADQNVAEELLLLHLNRLQAYQF